MFDTPKLLPLANRLAEALERTETMIVFAESCTAGLVAASLGTVPGVSKWFCGSAVTYQEQTKTDWLGVPPIALSEHGVVSEHVAITMARGALQQTSSASLAVAVTGHLGPAAPADQDGIVFIATAWRDVPSITSVIQIHLQSLSRVERQCEAACHVISSALEALRSEPDH